MHSSASELKIDKSIIDLIDTKRGLELLKGVSHIANSLDFIIVAEGVETKEQFDIIQQHTQIDKIQGYFFGKAIEKENIPAKIKNFDLNNY